MVTGPGNVNQSGPNLEALGFKSPMDVIDVLAMLKIDGEPVVKDDKAFLNPQTKAQEVLDYFTQNFNMSPKELPYFASAVKQEIKKGLMA